MFSNGFCPHQVLFETIHRVLSYHQVLGNEDLVVEGADHRSPMAFQLIFVAFLDSVGYSSLSILTPQVTSYFEGLQTGSNHPFPLGPVILRAGEILGIVGFLRN